MSQTRIIGLGLVVAFWILAPAHGVFPALLFDGVMLNSGISGESLAGAAHYEFGGHFGNGLYRYADGSLLAGGGPGELMRYSKEGRVLARYGLSEGGQLHGRVCRIGNLLCFIVARPNRYGLAKLLLDANDGDAATAIPFAGDLLQWNSHLCADPLSADEMIVAVNRDQAAPQVLAVNPTSGQARLLFIADRMKLVGPLAFDGKFLCANYQAEGRSWIGRLHLDGTPAAGGRWPVEQYWASMNGNVCLAENALFTLAYHGTVGRYTLDGEGAPGRVGEHSEVLGAPGQVVVEGNKVFAAGSPNRCLLEGELRDGQLHWQRLFGGVAAYGLAVDSSSRLHFVWTDPGQRIYSFWGALSMGAACDTPPPATVGSIYQYASGLTLVGERAYLLGRVNPPFTNAAPKPGSKVYCVVGDAKQFAAEPPDNGFSDPEGIAAFAYPGERSFLYVADTGNNAVKRMPAFESADNRSVPVSMQLTANGSFVVLDGPVGIAFDDAGNLYVAEKQRVSRFVRQVAPKFSRDWSITGAGKGTFQRLSSVAVSNNDMFVVDHDAHCLHRFRLSGETVETYGRVGVAGNAPAELSSPTAVAARGRFVYVADTGNFRILRLRIRDNLPPVR
ncbi:MAG: hypothetical protein AUJ92_09400 [Armatimonadetes bacterium CG2_30_59_28]|nr:hypothetical protein [Armatimonadota bacterium]OIO94706.1 MAG: hypothetical protein AUJ92_09400 [Armatimonadetes bacterium CG2_30_59_28]PIU61601.1 MAG: hypothetical protein COS85_20700 [Armatimonadetes bacterium CG07_land_8_20_14_0_80_59_28]PIX38228.1 MAG: hypothetical protein COZ56_21020 [Armatimonadetes bacterium CG_4_8_14_3_um_filter_58_9]PJB65129.1 MAG: hypothetical protein CO095_14355 [Armatimonadetes bacterium CG_4_9_14_3_um_filter_58_7]